MPTSRPNHALLVLTDLGRRLDKERAKELVFQLVDDPTVTDWSNRVPKRSGKGRPRHAQRASWPLASTDGVVDAIDAEPHVAWILDRIKADAVTIERLTSLRNHLAIIFNWTVRNGRGAPISPDLAARLDRLDVWLEYDLDD